MASGHCLPVPWVPARVHFVNAHAVKAQSDFSRAVVQTMLILPPIKAVQLIPKPKQYLA